MAATGIKTAIVAACVALVLLSMGAPAVADIQDDCRARCVPKCDGSAASFCRKLVDSFRILNLDALYTTCKVRLSSECIYLCIEVCSLNTLSDAAAPPPCKQY
ncbi:hypothetical protein SORBI_3005G203700 [Sorghum bicolor]|jgi:hypothetical protein|nr:hypothetical protein SORBI_3005G203700 [Sorghum bicolor]